MTFARQRYYQRVNASLEGLLSTEGAIIAAKNPETGALEETATVKQSDYANINQVANVRLLLLGTDNFGRDVTTELVAAIGVSLLIGLVAGLIATSIGLTLGLVAGYVGGLVDDIIMFVTNLFIVIPTFVLLILISFSIGQDQSRRLHHRRGDRVHFLGVDCQGSAFAGLLLAQSRPRQSVEIVWALSRPHHRRRHPALYRFLCGHGFYSSGFLGDPGGGRLVDPGLGTANDRDADPGADDELGDDLPGAYPGQVVGLFPRPPDHRADYIFHEPDEYWTRPGIQPRTEGMSDLMARVMLEVRDLTTKYITRYKEDVYAVDHVSLKVEEGKTLGIAGESGCGKSTLALSLMGYYFPPLYYTSGEIIIDGQNITGMKPDDVRKTILGTEIAYIPQAAMNALNPTRKIIDFIGDVVRAHDPTWTKQMIYDHARVNALKRWGCPPRCCRNTRSNFRAA